MKWWETFRYKHLAFLFLGIIFSIILSKVEFLNPLFLSLGSFGYIGAFIGGILFVSTFTLETGVLVLFLLTKTVSPLEIGIFAGLGAVLADFMFFRLVRNDLMEEITPLYNRLGGTHLTKIFRSKYLKWSLPIVGAIIIASPLPDEIGAGIMGISKIKTYQFLILSFVLNSIGIFTFISVYLLLK